MRKRQGGVDCGEVNWCQKVTTVRRFVLDATDAQTCYIHLLLMLSKTSLVCRGMEKLHTLSLSQVAERVKFDVFIKRVCVSCSFRYLVCRISLLRCTQLVAPVDAI